MGKLKIFLNTLWRHAVQQIVQKMNYFSHYCEGFPNFLLRSAENVV